MYEHDYYGDCSIRCDFKEAFKRCGFGLVLISIIVVLLIVTSNVAKASTIKAGLNKVTVKISSSDGAIFRFPKSVQTIMGAQRLEIKPANPTDPDYSSLSVRPRLTTGANDLVFILSDGRLVKVQVVIATKSEETESVYDFVIPDTQASSSADSPESGLLKAMLNGKVLNGYSVQEKKEKISSFLSNVKVELIRVVKGPELVGYVYQLTNTSWSKKAQIDVSQLSLGTPDEAILSQVDDDEIVPKGKGIYQTYLRVVAKSRSSSSGLILPVEMQELKNESQDKK